LFLFIMSETKPVATQASNNKPHLVQITTICLNGDNLHWSQFVRMYI
jgi:hypothetical protein